MSARFVSRALFVTNSAHLSDRPGGVQTCSREYLSLLRASGLDVKILEVDVDRRLPVRMRRRLRKSQYVGPISATDVDRMVAAMADADLLLLNQVNLAGALVGAPRGPSLAARTVLLSHGAEVTDLLHQARAPKRPGLKQSRPPMRAVDHVLGDEIRSRRGIAGAICLSPFDADFERWLGVKRTTWIPRTVASDALNWTPIAGRFGFLGTLNHPPNFEGLLEVLDAIDAEGVRGISVRVVGGPEEFGRWLQDRYGAVTYLGPLDDDTLKPEAATWSAFLNPIFCQARGCSTKLATALAWQIPIITTPVGRRGYVWRHGALIEANSVERFVGEMERLQCADFANAARLQTIAVAESCPTMEEVARTFVDFLAEVAGSPMPVKPG